MAEPIELEEYVHLHVMVLRKDADLIREIASVRSWSRSAATRYLLGLAATAYSGRIDAVKAVALDVSQEESLALIEVQPGRAPRRKPPREVEFW